MKLKTYSKLVASALCLSMMAATPASAAKLLGLFNTGVDAVGNKIGTDNVADTHYLVGGANSLTTSNPAYVTSPTAAYIASGTSGSGGSATYNLTFTVTGDLADAWLTGDVAFDNGVRILLNGTEIYSLIPPPDGVTSTFNQLHAFGANSGFLSGTNVLSFEVTDFVAPSGLMVTNLVGSVPETATWIMMLMGFGAIGYAVRRKPRRALAFAS